MCLDTIKKYIYAILELLSYIYFSASCLLSAVGLDAILKNCFCCGEKYHGMYRKDKGSFTTRNSRSGTGRRHVTFNPLKNMFTTTVLQPFNTLSSLSLLGYIYEVLVKYVTQLKNTPVPPKPCKNWWQNIFPTGNFYKTIFFKLPSNGVTWEGGCGEGKYMSW